MLFRDGQRYLFPRQIVTEEQVETARDRDRRQKQDHQEKINDSKYRINTKVNVGDSILMRNFKRKSKFEPVFIPEPCRIMSISEDGLFVTLNNVDGKIFRRHLDDIKIVNIKEEINMSGESNTQNEAWLNEEWNKRFELCCQEADEQMDSVIQRDEREGNNGREEVREDGSQPVEADGNQIRRSTRSRIPNPRYFNDDVVN